MSDTRFAILCVTVLAGLYIGLCLAVVMVAP